MRMDSWMMAKGISRRLFLAPREREGGWYGIERGEGNRGRKEEANQKSTLRAVGGRHDAVQSRPLIWADPHASMLALDRNPSLNPALFYPQPVGPASRGVGEERAHREEGDLRAQEVGRHLRHRRQGALRQSGEVTPHLRRPLLPRQGKRNREMKWGLANSP